MDSLTRSLVRPALRATAVVLLLGVVGCQGLLGTPSAPGVASAKPDLKIRVVDGRTNQPIAGVLTRLFLSTGGSAVPLTTAETGDDGYATYVDPDPGQYLVFAKTTGTIGSSTFALVNSSGAVSNVIKLYPMSDLLDVVTQSVTSAGGTVQTDANQSVPQTSVTFPSGALPSTTPVTVGTLVGQQIPILPPNRTALNAVMIEIPASTNLNGLVTISLGLPFDIPNGVNIPMFAYNDLTGVWQQIAVGSTVGGNVVASLDSLGAISALASFVPSTRKLENDVVLQSKSLGFSDGPTVSHQWVPTLTFPAETSYSDRTKMWLTGTIEQIVGMKFGVPIVTTVTRDPSVMHMLEIYQTVEQFTISVNFGGGRPTRGADYWDFRANAVRQWLNLTKIHNSGFAMGG